MAKGSVRKKGKKWYARFYIEDESGRKVQKEFVGTESKSETEALLRKAIADYEEKKFVAKSENITVGMLLDLWVEEELKPDRKPKAENRNRRPFTGVYRPYELRRDKPRRYNFKAYEQRLYAAILGGAARLIPFCGISQKADNL